MSWRGVRLGLVVAGALAAGGVRWTPQGCGALGWKWASVDGVCVTPACHALGGCGQWANPGLRCGRVRVGDPAWRVYFELGEPDSVAGAEARWHRAKGEPGEVAVRLVGGQVEAVDCGERVR